MSKNIFITGTGTDVGKTFVTGLIVKKLRDMGLSATYYKAAASGNEIDLNGNIIPGDGEYVRRIAGIDEKLENMVSYSYVSAVSPHLAAKMEGNPVNLEVVKEAYQKNCEKYDFVTMEGSGGIICPIRYDEQEIWLEDIIKGLGLSTLLVADAGLGTINAVGLTVEYLRQKNIPVKGIIFNHYHEGNIMEEDNKVMIEKMTGIPVVAWVKDGDTELDIDIDKLVSFYE